MIELLRDLGAGVIESYARVRWAIFVFLAIALVFCLYF